MKTIPKDKINKILIIRPEMIGDTILLTSLVSAIKHKYKKAKIYLLLREEMQCIVDNNADVEGSILVKNNTLSLLELFSLSKKIKAMNFDISIILEDNPTPQFAWVSMLARIPYRIGDKNRLLYGWIYNYGIRINSDNPVAHHLDLYYQLLKPMQINNYQPLKLLVNSNDKDFVSNKFNLNNAIGIHIGTGGGNRALLPQSYAQIANNINQKYQKPVVLIGGANEIKTLNSIKPLLNFNYIDAVNVLSLPQLFALISKLAIFIGVDSGPLHAAAAFKIPTIAIYTAKDVKPVRWFPWMTSNIIIKSPMNCTLRCSHRECQKDYCLIDISFNEIVDGVEKLLQGMGNNNVEETRKAAL